VRAGRRLTHTPTNTHAHTPDKTGDGLTAQLTEEGTIPDETFQKAMVRTAEEALAAANRIGYPVMLKASEGACLRGF
jgi:acetyl-CoA carboxylase / biotin carboxylase 1